MDDKIILNILFFDNNLRICLSDYTDCICSSDTASLLLNTYTKYFSDPSKSLNATLDDFDAIFMSEFDADSDELQLWNEVKSLKISDYDTVKPAVIKHISKQLKEYFFAKAFTEDKYDLEKLEELYKILSDITLCKYNTENSEETIILNDIDDCCNCYATTATDGVKFFDERVSNTLSSKQFDGGTINVIMGAPGRGKTQLILNQGISVAAQGKDTLHIALGDLTKRQLILRLLAIITKKPIQQLSLLSKSQFKNFISEVQQTYPDIFEHFYSKIYLPNTLTGLQLIQKIEELQKKQKVHFSQIVIDYDGNIETDLSSNTKSRNKSEESKSMYYAGADIYNSFASFAKKNNSVIWVLSQPKVQYWSVEKIPLEALSDSSKKGHIVDFCMSIGKKDVTEDITSLFISKNRHGEANVCLKCRQIGATQSFEPIQSGDWYAS